MRIIINFFTKSLKRELITVIVLTHAIMMGFFVYDLTEQQKDFLHKQSFSQVKSLARTIAENSTVWVLSNDYVGMEELITSVSSYPSLKYAMLVDTQNKVLAHTNKELINKYTASTLDINYLNPKLKLIEIINNENIIDIAVPIMVSNRLIGWARVALSQENNTQGIQEVLKKGIAYTVGAIIIGWLFAYILAIGFTKSLHKLIEISKKTAQGQRGLQVPSKRKDEIGLLSQEINKMLIKLDENDKKLGDFNKELEEQIEQKTKSLEEKNKQLKENEAKLKQLNDDLEERITYEVNKIKKIQEKLSRSEKLASMGEMIGNIAHQWRQPLSVISTITSGIQVQSEVGIINNESIQRNCKLLNKNVQYLSTTIDDFRDFIKGDSEVVLYNLNNEISSFLRLMQTTIKEYHISVHYEEQEEININGYPKELIQAIINIFNNSKEALILNNIENKLVFINIYKVGRSAFIEIKDNALGIDDKIINKIFEPYFTTKHQSQGTGLGLHRTYSLITDDMGGNIEISNESYIYNDVEYNGAKVKIELPINN